MKYMVGGRCRDRIGEELVKLGILPDVNQGVLEFQDELNEAQLLQLKEGLIELGYEVLDPGNSKFLDRISHLIKDLIDRNPEMPVTDYPIYLKSLGLTDPETMQIFSQVHGVDLLQYITLQQIERIKEMLLYENLELKEIVKLFNFKNGDQLTKIFEENTGLRPSYYIEIRNKRKEVRKENGFGENECEKGVKV